MGLPPTVPSDPLAKSLYIKMNAVKRIHREYLMYKQEKVEQSVKIDQMIRSEAEPADVSKQTEVLGDTLSVLPDTVQRLRHYSEQLSVFLDEHYQHIPCEAQPSEHVPCGEVPPERAEPSEEVVKLVLEARQLVRDHKSADEDGALERKDMLAAGLIDEF